MPAVSFPFVTMNNVTDPADLDPAKGEAVLLQNVDMDAGGGIAQRLGRTSVLSGNYRCGWSDGSKAFLVKGSGIYAFDGTAEALVTTLSSSTLPVDFEAVNDVVVYSNGVDFGVIENGVAYPRPIPAEPFKEAMMPGSILAFLSPTLLVARGNVLYRSDPFRTDQMDERHNVKAVFRDEIRLVLPVDDGCYVVTANEIWWLGGTNDEGADQKLLASYGGARGTGVITSSDKVKALQMVGRVALWASAQGICAGGNGGNFVNLSAGKVSIDCGESGAAMLREQGGLTHYVSCIATAATPYNQYVSPALDVDTQDL